MALFKNNPQGGIMDTIRCDEKSYLIWKWRPAGTALGETSRENAIRWGSPIRVKEGSVAVFNILEKEGLIIGYGWFRGNRIDQRAAIEAYQIINNSHTPGPSHTGRETIKPNGSLVIQSVKKQDEGTYTVITVKADLTNVSASGQLQVYSECFLSALGVLGRGGAFCSHWQD